MDVVATSYKVVVPRSALSEELLDDEAIRYEPLVVLGVSEEGVSARKLTMREKLVHADRTGGSIFAGSEGELEEMFALLDERAEHSGKP